MTPQLTGEGTAGAAVKKKHCNFRLETVTFEPRHENKTCSACQEWLNERLKECESEIARESESEKVWGWVLSIEMKTKVVKRDWMRDWMSVTVRKSEIVWESESEKVWIFQNIPGSQLLSDIQTFFYINIKLFIVPLSWSYSSTMSFVSPRENSLTYFHQHLVW